MNIVRLSHFAVYLWMLGSTFMLLGLAIAFDAGPEAVSHIWSLGAGLLGIAVLLPPAEAFGRNLGALFKRLQASRDGGNGGDEA